MPETGLPSIRSGPTWRATVNRGLAKQTYAVLAGSATQQWVGEQMRLLGVIATLVSVKSNEEGVRRVAEGGADAAGHTLIGVNFANQDYLSLSDHPRILAAAQQAMTTFGVHSAGSAALMIAKTSARVTWEISGPPKALPRVMLPRPLRVNCSISAQGNLRC